MKTPLRFVVIGLGGMAKVHLDAVAWLENQELGRLTGVVALESDRQRFPELVASLHARNVSLHDAIDDFLRDAAGSADVLTVPIGIHQHVPVSIAALQAGLHVYCEKPVAATIQEVDQLIATQHATDKMVAINFQNLSSPSMQQLKARICDGRLGRVKTGAALCCWPRSRNYFARNDWAGKLRTNGAWVLDSPLNNALAHYLLNLLYLASPQPNDTALPIEVTAELYRAGNIESFDTIALRVRCKNDVVLHCYFTLSSANVVGPEMELHCEKGEVIWRNYNGETRIQYHDGREEVFDNGPPSWIFEGFRNFARAVRGEEKLLCSPEIGRGHTLCVNGTHESCPVIHTFPPTIVSAVVDKEMSPFESTAVFDRVTGLEQVLRQAFEQRKLPAEMGAPWASAVEPFGLAGYNHFPSPAGKISHWAPI